MSRRVRALLEHHFALRKEFPVRPRRAQGLVKEVANRAGLTRDVTPHVLRHTFAATAPQKGISLATSQGRNRRDPAGRPGAPTAAWATERAHEDRGSTQDAGPFPAPTTPFLSSVVRPPSSFG